MRCTRYRRKKIEQPEKSYFFEGARQHYTLYPLTDACDDNEGKYNIDPEEDDRWEFVLDFQRVGGLMWGDRNPEFEDGWTDEKRQNQAFRNRWGHQ